MKITTRTIELNAEQSETFLVHRRKMVIVRCKMCGTQAIMLPPETAASVMRIALREIYRQIERNQVHFIEDDDGSMLVCVESLLPREKKLNPRISKRRT